MLEALAVSEGLTASDWIRMRIRREFMVFAAKSKPKQKRQVK